MKKFLRKTRGSISIFVALMMIPMLAFTGLMVDFARMNMAMGQARNTAHLAANSALAYYDTLLHEIYGLLATSQDWDEIERFAQVLAETSMGADDVGFNILGSTNPTLTMTANDPIYSLNNMTYMQYQILEYMRFRVVASLGGMDLGEWGSIEQTINEADYINGTLAGVWNAVGELQKSYGRLLDSINAAEGQNTAGLAFKINNDLKDIRSKYDELDAIISESEFETVEALVNKIEELQQQINSFTGELSPTQEAEKGALIEEQGELKEIIDEMKPIFSDIKEIAAGLEQDRIVYEQKFDNARTASYEVDHYFGILDSLITGARAELDTGLATGQYSEETAALLKEDLDSIYSENDIDKRFAINQNNGIGGETLFGEHGQKFFDDNRLDIKYGDHELSAVIANATEPFGDITPFVGVTIEAEPIIITEYNSTAKNEMHKILNRPLPDDISEESVENSIENLGNTPTNEPDQPTGRENCRTHSRLTRGLPIPVRFVVGRTPPNMRSAYRQDNRIAVGGVENSFSLGGVWASIGDSLVCRVLQTEYAIQMFSNYTTNRVLRDGKRPCATCAANPSNAHQDCIAEYDMTLSGIPIHLENGLNFWYGSELEYLFKGSEEARENHDAVRKAITVIRTACNTVYTFRCSILKAEINAIKLIPYVGPALSVAYRVAIVAAETTLDVNRLLNGGKVPLIKSIEQTGNYQWVSGGYYLMAGRAGGNQWNTVGGNPRHEGSKGLYYYEWLRLMILFLPEETVSRRISSLIEMNMNYHLALQNGSNNLPSTPIHFKLSNAYVVAETQLDYDFRHFFIGGMNFGGLDNYGRSSRFRAIAQRGY